MHRICHEAISYQPSVSCFSVIFRHNFSRGGGVQKILPTARIVPAAGVGKFLKFSVQNGAFSAVFGNENRCL